MKKTVKRTLFLAGAIFLSLSFSSCKALWGALTSADGERKSDSDHVDLTDDGSVQEITSIFQKLEKFHGDLGYFSGTRDLYTIQVNRAQGRKYETGYIYPVDLSRASVSVEKGAEVSVPVSEMRINRTPDFITEFYKDRDKFLNNSNMARSSVVPGLVDPDDNENSDSKTYKTGSTRNFYVAESLNKTGTGTNKDAKLIYNGDHCLVYLAEEKIKKIDDYKSMSYSNSIYEFPEGYLEEYGRTFDNLYEKIIKVMGSDDLTSAKVYNKNRNYKTISTPKGDDEKIILFVNDLFNDKLGSKSGSVLGYFWECDLYNNVSFSTNKAKILYLDSYNLQQDAETNGKVVHSTMVHEFTHMLNFIQKGTGFDTWFTEMLAMTSEDIMSKDLNLSTKDLSSVFFLRLSYFNFLYGNGFSSEVWDKDFNSAYANTYAFGAYLLRNYGGIKLINSIATNSYINEEAITQALHSNGYRNESFETVLAKFGQVLINTENKTSKDKTITLNRSLFETKDSKSFNIQGIDLKNYKITYTDDNGSQTVYEGPQFKDNKYQYSIGGWGFEVKYMGPVSAYKKFDAQLPTNQSCDLYINIK